jgi:hypothetical protein
MAPPSQELEPPANPERFSTIIAFVGGEKDAVTVQETPEQVLKDR